jgi:hypothetical protein
MNLLPVLLLAFALTMIIALLVIIILNADGQQDIRVSVLFSLFSFSIDLFQ